LGTILLNEHDFLPYISAIRTISADSMPFCLYSAHIAPIWVPHFHPHYISPAGGKPMVNCLISHGIISPSGKVNKDKINLVSGAAAPPFAEMVWLSSGGDAETINRLTSILTSMNTQNEREALFRLIQMLYGLLGLKLSKEASLMAGSDETLEYFLHSFIIDFGEIMSDYLIETM
jgi:hypothetical protein